MNINMLGEFQIEGTTKDELFTALQYISDHTEIITADIRQLSLPYYIGKKEKDDSWLLFFTEYDNGKEKQFSIKQERLIQDDDDSSELRKTRTIAHITNDYYFISNVAINQCLSQEGISGVMQTKSRYKNLWISEMMAARKKTPVTLILRTKGNTRRIVSIQSAQYRYIDQKNLIYLVERLYEQGYHIKNWVINNTLTEINVEDDSSFGFRIITSDTGASSLTITPVYYTVTSFVIIDNCSNLKFIHRKSVEEKTCESKDRRKIDMMLQYAGAAFDSFQQRMQEMEKKKITANEEKEIIDIAIKMSKQTGFMKAAGKKNIANFLKENLKYKTPDSELELVKCLWEMKYSNTEDQVSLSKFHNAKKLLIER